MEGIGGQVMKSGKHCVKRGENWIFQNSSISGNKFYMALVVENVGCFEVVFDVVVELPIIDIW